MMSKKQRIYLIVDLWPKACRAQGWDENDDALRHEQYRIALGRPKRFSQFIQQDFDRVKARFMMLANSVQGAIETDNPDLGDKRRLLHVIKNEQVPCLALYVPEPWAYIRAVARDKFRIFAGLATVDSLSAATLDETDTSELSQLRMTLARCINDLRGKAGDTIRRMEIRARLLFPVRCQCGWEWDARSVEEAEREFNAHFCPLRTREEELAEVERPF